MGEKRREEAMGKARRAVGPPVANSLILKRNGDPYGTRTRVTAVKGRCPRPLDEGVAAGMIYPHRPPPSSLLPAKRPSRRSAEIIVRQIKKGLRRGMNVGAHLPLGAGRIVGENGVDDALMIRQRANARLLRQQPGVNDAIKRHL